MNLFLSLGQELQSRGHRLTFFNLPENKGRILSAGFGFVSVEPTSLPSGTLGRMIADMGKAKPLTAMRIQGRFDNLRYKAILSQLPASVGEIRLDSMIVDQAEACSGSVAEGSGLPWVSIASGLCLNSEPLIPPFFTSWAYGENRFSEFRNRVTYTGLKIVTRQTESLINRYRKHWGLRPLERMNDTFSPFSQISQQVSDFDFPRRELPDCFHYVGPITSNSQKEVDFPWSRLDGRPLIYASLGTLVNRHRHLYRAIAESCHGLGPQLVITLGGSDAAELDKELPGSPLVVTYAPQLALLARASLTITHAGLNTTLESLTYGVPLVAIPITFEQPGIAARIHYTGVGEFLPMSKVTVGELRARISRVLGRDAYKTAATRMSQSIRASGGRQAAAEIVEEVTRTKRPVSRERAIRPKCESAG